MVGAAEETGWALFAPEVATVAWAQKARGAGLRALKAPHLAHMYQCERTWFVGLDALPNGPDGDIDGSGPLRGAAVDAVLAQSGFLPTLHRAQLSVVWPGYPRPREGESDAGFRYRRDRDAAHVDGVMREGSPKRRFVREPHAFIIGVTLTETDPGAAPLVVWEGSHLIMARAFRSAFAGHSPDSLSAMDVTEVYQTARREVFDTCPRILLHGSPGTVSMVHRLALHGVAPWTPGAYAPE
ncbi:hypothetical protein, partial [Roseobacter sp.]|uniref:hypothetical protein n=1 Tax=Roseobacter sp. TaxID=1907202 RepID=UPI0025EFB7CA